MPTRILRAAKNYSYDAATGEYKLNKTIEEIEADGGIVLTGTDVKDAKAAVSQDDLSNKVNVVSLSFTKEGTKKFAEATKSAYEAGKDSIGIYYDGSFVSVPNVQSEIKDGNAQIDGMASAEEAENLASTIRIGGLKLELTELRSSVVAAQLGRSYFHQFACGSHWSCFDYSLYDCCVSDSGSGVRYCPDYLCVSGFDCLKCL